MRDLSSKMSFESLKDLPLGPVICQCVT